MIVSSPSCLHASNRCSPSTRTKRSPSCRTRIGLCRPFAVLPHQDRALPADLEDALGDLLRLLGAERRAPFHWHVDVGRSRTSRSSSWLATRRSSQTTQSP